MITFNSGINYIPKISQQFSSCVRCWVTVLLIRWHFPQIDSSGNFGNIYKMQFIKIMIWSGIGRVVSLTNIIEWIAFWSTLLCERRKHACEGVMRRARYSLIVCCVSLFGLCMCQIYYIVASNVPHQIYLSFQELHLSTYSVYLLNTWS